MTFPALRIPAHVHARAFDGEVVLLHLEKGEYFSLDEVGTAVWEAIAAGRPLEAVIAEVAEAYAEPHGRVADDVTRLLSELEDRGLVEKVAASARTPA
jgi:hypothetical protein